MDVWIFRVFLLSFRRSTRKIDSGYEIVNLFELWEKYTFEWRGGGGLVKKHGYDNVDGVKTQIDKIVFL